MVTDPVAVAAFLVSANLILMAVLAVWVALGGKRHE